MEITTEELLDYESNRIVRELTTTEPGSPEYKDLLDHASKLLKLLEAEEKRNSKVKSLLANPALLGIIGNLAMAVLLINHERLNVVTTSAVRLLGRNH